MLDEVNIMLHRDDPARTRTWCRRWKGSAISELTVPLCRRQPELRIHEGL